MKFKLFSQVTLREDIPKYGLKKGARATIVEYYQTPEAEEDGYSLEGFHVEGITIEVAESQIEAIKASVLQRKKSRLTRESIITGGRNKKAIDYHSPSTILR